MTDSLSPWFFENPDLTQNNPVGKTVSKDRALLTRMLEHKHMVETIERFEWKNLPPELPSDLIERILYFRFKGCLFKSPLDRYLFLPFTLKGRGSETIDSYGRYLTITPVLFTGQWREGGDGKKSKDIDYIQNKSYTVVYDLPDAEKAEAIEGKDFAVILQDSSLEVSQDYTPMAYLQRPINEQLTDILVLVNMDLISSAKAFYIVAKDEDQKDAIEAEFRGLDERILNGKRYVVVTSPTDLKELTGSSVKDTARYFQSYQSIDNLRKDIIGVSNGGTFQKQEHTTEMETMTNSNSGSSVLNNALRIRQDFCTIANKVFGLNIAVEIKGNESQDIVEEEGAQTLNRRGEGEE